MRLAQINLLKEQVIMEIIPTFDDREACGHAHPVTHASCHRKQRMHIRTELLGNHCIRAIHIFTGKLISK